MIIRKVAAAAAAVLALACAASPALGHQDPSTKGFVSRVTGIAPAIPGLAAKVVFGDDQLEVTAPRGKTVIFKGYEGEPYVKFDPTGVYWNDRSPARYLNSDRFARLAPPAKANAKAPPQWVKVASGRTFSWHDHRIHWMSPIHPPAVRNAPAEPHHVLDWRVSGEVQGGRDFVVSGTLDYDPKIAGVTGSSSSSTLPLVAGLVGGAVLVGGAALLLVRRRRSRHADAPV